jgi:hypothetical protein
MRFRSYLNLGGGSEVHRNQTPGILSQRRPRWNSGRNILCRRITESLKTDDVYKIEPIFKKRKMGKRVQYLVKWLGYPESFSSWILKQDLQKHTTPTWSVSLANGTEWHGQCIVFCDLWKEDSTFGGRIFVSGNHSVHGYRSQHLQLNGQIGEQYLVEGLVEQLSGITAT